MYYNCRDTGIVLRSYDYGEGHRIMVIFTKNSGKVKAVAKGSRKTKSRFGSKLEPFSENEFLLYRKPGSELFTITGCYPIESNKKIREDMKRYGFGAVMVEGVNLLTAEEDPDRKIYHLLKKYIKYVREKKAAPSAWLFLFKLLKYSGYRLNMFSCVFCGAPTGGGMAFIPSEGGISCRDCFSRKKPFIPVKYKTLKVIKRLSPDREIPPRIEREIGNIIHKFVKYQFGKELNSVKFIEFFRNKEELSEKK
ncbi:MAG: DNA repair protein RecO [Elusimicrobiota bacterium]